MNNKKEIINAYKVVLIGDSGVGKSSIIHNYLTKKFSPKYDTTIGTDFISKKIELDNNFSINLQIWDTVQNLIHFILFTNYSRQVRNASDP